MPDRAEVPNDEPAMTLLGDVSAVELQLLGEVDPSLRNADLLHTVSWLEVAQLVVVPSWRRMVARVSAQCLAGLTAQTLPDAVDRLRDIGALIPSPRGMLLNVGQRAQRAGEVVEMALGLALLNDGWQVSVVPGQSFFQRGTETLNTMHLMDKIQAGEISREKWVEQCQALGIAELRLVDGRALQGRAI